MNEFANSQSCTTPCNIFEALESRRSVRAFLPRPVERATVERILSLASRAPSGTNTQPWRVWVAAGKARDRLVSRMLAAHQSKDAKYQPEYQYYPLKWREPYLSRRRAVGKDLYSLLGIAKGDEAGMQRQFGENYMFFGAPVCIFVGIDRDMEKGSWLDLGGFVQSILLATRGFGLHSIPQAAFSRFHQIIREELGIPGEVVIACGISLGYEDEAAAVNRLVVPREPVSSFAAFRWD